MRAKFGAETPGGGAPARREVRVRVTLDLQAAQSDWWARGSGRERGGSRVETSSAVLERGGPASPDPCVGNPSHLPEVGPYWKRLVYCSSTEAAAV